MCYTAAALLHLCCCAFVAQRNYRFVKESCPNLEVKGLMTIGAPDDFSCFDK